MIIYNGRLFTNYRALKKYQDDSEFKPKFLCRNISLPPIDSILPPMKSIQFGSFLPNITVEPFPSIFPYQIRSQITEVFFLSDVDSERQQASQLNYNSFIHVMAEMIQKYAPKILNIPQEDT